MDLVTFSLNLLRTSRSKEYAAGIAQAFISTDPSVKIRRDQWEQQLPELGATH